MSFSTLFNFVYKFFCHTKTGGSDPVRTLDIYSRSVCGGRFWFSALINLAWCAWSFSFLVCAVCRKWRRIFMKADGAGLRRAASNDSQVGEEERNGTKWEMEAWRRSQQEKGGRKWQEEAARGLDRADESREETKVCVRQLAGWE